MRSLCEDYTALDLELGGCAINLHNNTFDQDFCKILNNICSLDL